MVITRRPTLEFGSRDNHELKLIFKNGSRCGSSLILIKGLILTALGIIMAIWTPFQLAMEERLRMHRGLPAFDWWETPPDLLLMKARVFNYTNIERFLTGLDSKLKVEEVGPIIYRESLSHSNVTFNDNSTVSYTANHRVTFAPELNTLSLNDTIIIPNYALLSMVTYLHNAPFFAKFGFNMLVRRLNTRQYLNITLYDFLWNFTDPILDLTNSLVPSLVPVNNMGMLQRIYEDFEDRVTMFIGTKYGHEQFSLIDKFGGSNSIPNYKNCDDRLTNATEGVTYNQYLTRDSVLKYWRKTICKVVRLTYQKDLAHSGFNAYKYTLPKNVYDRTYPIYNDCYKGSPPLPSGLTDVSNCLWDVPIAASFPHFMYGEKIIKDYVEGLQPDVEKHESFVIAEPYTGIPLESVARSQSNLRMRKISGFNVNVTKFGDMALPMFWLEYYQTGIPFKVWLLTYFTIVLVPPGQIVFTTGSILLGFYYVVCFGRALFGSKHYRKINLEQRMVAEQENFLPDKNFEST